MTADDIPAAPSPFNFRADEIILYGIRLNSIADYADLPIDEGMSITTRTTPPKEITLALRLSVVPGNADEKTSPVDRGLVSMAVIYGYAFEGHCYRLDKPRMLVFAHGVRPVDAEGCGFAAPYTMWRITSKTTLLDLPINVGLAEDLVLNANLPGNRPPNTYGNDMQLAHRGGRLNRTGGT